MLSLILCISLLRKVIQYHNIVFVCLSDRVCVLSVAEEVMFSSFVTLLFSYVKTVPVLIVGHK